MLCFVSFWSIWQWGCLYFTCKSRKHIVQPVWIESTCIRVQCCMIQALNTVEIRAFNVLHYVYLLYIHELRAVLASTSRVMGGITPSLWYLILIRPANVTACHHHEHNLEVSLTVSGWRYVISRFWSEAQAGWLVSRGANDIQCIKSYLPVLSLHLSKH